ncbi:glucosamine-6-phosphate deaminase [uncultured Clostridium sp.]|uniref:glucosamine-6-phosphate deaminase n=1 Tax=uncultured Clostridium sp. TaxID=59620 RepID=UPI002624A497|nr:glucosamine-6-phosphate deaminase [uncultured Clostridium sp.]
MRLIVVKNYDEMSKVGAEEMASVIKENPKAILGLATGGTPEGMYKELIRMNKDGEIDFKDITSVNLDEYVGLQGDHPQSYRYFMNTHLLDYINIDKTKTFVPNGLAKDINEEGRKYDQMIDNLGGIDIQLLGVGTNGHIAFNEPDGELVAGTHLTGLTQSTIDSNSRYFESADEVPKTAITMGLGQIMKSKKILLLASGENKAEAMKELFSGKIGTSCPVTMLQMHKDVTVVLDEAAAKLINR